MASPFADDPRAEGPLADLTSAGMWTTAGVVGGAMFLLPGSPHEHLLPGLAVAAFAILWGVVSFAMYRRGWSMTIGTRAIVTASTAPIVAWRSGPPAARRASCSRCCSSPCCSSPTSSRRGWPWPLVALFAFVVRDAAALRPDRARQRLPGAHGRLRRRDGRRDAPRCSCPKRRLLRAEARQRVMAERDPLTGLYNRRWLEAGSRRHRPPTEQALALVLFDVDSSRRQRRARPPVGDAVLCAVAEACE